MKKIECAVLYENVFCNSKFIFNFTLRSGLAAGLVFEKRQTVTEVDKSYLKMKVTKES